MTRAHHYQFAHESLPAHFFSDVANWTKLLQMDGAVFLHFLWTTTGKGLNKDEVLPYALEFERRKTGKFDIYLITMPLPTENGEAYFLFFATDGRKHIYYTLEFSRDLNDGSKIHALHCEWLADGTHKNLGQLDSPDIELFVRKCITQM